MSDPFASGGASDVSITDFEGNLLLITPTEFLTGDEAVETQFGPKDVVVADVVVLDGDEVEEHSGLYIFQGKLLFLKRYVGKKPYLGRLGKGDTKVNGNFPWVLEAATEEDKQVAREYLEKRKSDDPFAV
jgi:hypothetical protein